MPGFVPNVTIGVSVATSMFTSRSKRAPASLGSVRQRAHGRVPAAPCGASGRPARYSYVVSSGAIMPARAPASIDMLQIVMRSSIDSARIALPRYSMTWPVPPPTPIVADHAQDHVLRGDARRQLAVEIDRERLRLALQQALRREHVADLGRADAERERAERRRACSCASRRRRSSCRVATRRARARSRARCRARGSRSRAARCRSPCSSSPSARTCFAAAGSLTISRSLSVFTGTVGVE